MGILRASCSSLLLLAACGGDMSGLTGVYTIESWTDNPDSCDAEGPPSFNSETALYVKEENFFGAFLNVVPCSDLADCDTMAGDSETIHLGNWGFIEGNDDDGWTESNAYAFSDFETDSICTATGTTSTMSSPAEGQIRIEVRTVHSAEYPATGPEDDRCPDAGAEAAVEGLPCEELEVVVATFDHGLP